MPTSFVDLNLDTASFERQLNVTLARASARDVNITVHMNTSEIDKAKKSFSGLERSVSNATTGLNTYTGRLGLLATTVATIGPTLIPVFATTTAAAGGLASALLSAGGAGGAFGLSVKGQVDAMKKSQQVIQTTQKSLDAYKAAQAATTKGTDAYKTATQNVTETQKKLATQQKDFNKQFGPAAKGFNDLTSAWGRFLGATRPETTKVMGHALEIVAGILPRLVPLANAAGKAVDGLVQDFGRFTKTAEFQGILNFFQRTGPAAITAFGTAAGHVLHGTFDLLKAFAPLQGTMLKGVNDLAKAFDNWASHLDTNKGFQGFLAYAKANGPAVLDLVKQIGVTGLQLVKAYAPIGQAVLPLLTQFAKLVGEIAKIPFAAQLITGAIAFNKLNSAIAPLSKNITAFAASSEKGASAMAKFGGAAKQVAGAAGVGLLADGLTHSTRQFSALETAAGGAALGFAVGGPFGAAVGGAAGLLGGMANQFIHAGDAAKAAYKKIDDYSPVKAAIANLENLKATLDQVTGAYTGATRAAVLQKLQQSGAIGIGKKYGVGARELVNTVLGQGNAYEKLSPILDAYSQKVKNVNDKELAAEKAIQPYVKDGTLANARKLLLGGFGDKADPAFLALEKQKKALQERRAELQKLPGILKQDQKETQRTSAITADYTGKLKAIPKNVRSKIQADGIIPTTKGIADVAAKYKLIDKKEIRSLISASGADTTVKQVQGVIAKMKEANNSRATPQININASGALGALARARAELDALNGRVSRSYIDITTRHFGGHTVGGATGGFIQGPGTGTSDSIPARLSNGEFVMRAAAVAKYGIGAMQRMNAMRFAGGGPVSKTKKVFGEATIRDLANGIAKGFDAAQISRELTNIVKHDFSGQREKQMLARLDKLNTLTERIKRLNEKVSAATTVLANRRQARSDFVGNVKSAIAPDISQFGSTPGGILGGLSAQKSAAQAFVKNIRALNKAGFPRALIAQVIGLGLTDGNAAATQLLGLSKKDRAAVTNDFNYLNKFANQQGKALGDAYYNAGIKAAKGQLDELKKRQKEIDDRFRHAARAFADELQKILLPKPKKGKHKATHDQGGWLDVGTSLVTNSTGQPEAVLNPSQWDRIDRLVAAMERGGGRNAPLIGHAVIHENVDLDRHERQRAFRDRMTNVGG